MGGKSSPKPPDYEPMAKASERAAELSYDMGQQQLDFAREQYNEMKPIYEDVANSQMAAQDQSMRMAEELYSRKKDTYYPVEDQFIQTAQQFNTDAFQEQLSRKAAAEAGQAFAATQAGNERAMAGMGVNPASGRFQGIQNASTLGLSAQRANAMTSSRERSDQMGRALLADAASLGGNLTGLSQSAYNVANQSGTAGAQNMAQPGQTYMGGLAQGAGTIQQGMNTQISGLGNVLNAQTSVYQSDLEANAAKSAAFGQAVGMVGGGLASGGYLPGGA